MYYSFSSKTNFGDQEGGYDHPTVTTPPFITSKKRILIVDDEQDITGFFKLALEHAGFIVDVYNDPLESLSNYKTGRYGLLLLDIWMPQINGFELYDKIKEIDDKAKVCFITAFQEFYEEYNKLFYNKGCFIIKPIGIHDLIRIVESQLNYN